MDTTIDTLAIEIETEAGKSLTNIDKLISRLDKLYESLAKVTTHYSKLQNVLKDVNKIKIKDTVIPKKTLSKSTKTKVVDSGSTESIVADALKTSKEKIIDIDDKKIKDAKEKTKKLKEEAKDTKTAFERLKSAIDSTSSSAKSISKITAVLNGTKNGVKRIEETFRKSFAKSMTGTIKKFGLAMIGVRSLFTALRASVQEYLHYDTQLEDSLRNNWAVLGSLLAPILEKVIQLFGIAVAYVRAFIKALTGIDLVARANKKSLDSVSASAKKTLGNLAKFDDLNVVVFPTGSSSGSVLPPLTTPEIDTKNLDWFVKYIKEGNWYGLGMEMARRFNDSLRKIDFDWFEKKARQWATNIADLFNGLTDGTDWMLVGEKIAGGLNTAFAFVNTFFDRYNWDNLGTSLATGMNSMIENVNWSGLGQFFSNKLRALIEGGYTFITTFDFGALGEGFGDTINSFISNIDWGKGAKTLIEGITGLFKTALNTIRTIKWDNVGKSISDFLVSGLETLNEKIENLDHDKVSKPIKSAITDLVSNIDWAKILKLTLELVSTYITGVFKYSLTEARDLFSELLSKLTGYITQDVDKDESILTAGEKIITRILAGIVKGLGGIGQWARDNISAPIINGVAKSFGIDNGAKKWESLGSAIPIGIGKGADKEAPAMFEIFRKNSLGISGIFAKVKDNASISFGGIKKDAETTFNETTASIMNNTLKWTNAISNPFIAARSIIEHDWSESKIGSIFQKVFNKIKSIFKNIGTTISSAIGSDFVTVLNKIINFAEKTINKFIRDINKVIGVVNELPGVNIKKLSTINIPDIKLDTGTNRIEAEGLYHLHKNEAVVPEKYNPAVNDDVYNNKDVVEGLNMVYRAINNLGITNIVNLGNKTLYKETVKYAKNQNDIYGENVMSF